jgi:hypothetical protein
VNLVIEPRAAKQVVPTMPDADDPEVTRWLDRRGIVCALGHTVAGEHWIHVLELASFRFGCDHDTVTAVPLAVVETEEIVDRFTRTVWPTVLQLRGKEVLHASAVQTSQGVVAFCALSETGKSTLAYGLSRRGYRLWADDAVVLDMAAHEVKVLSLPFKARLRPASAVYFGHSRKEAYAGYRWEGAQRQEGQAQALSAICLLDRSDEGASEPVVKIHKLSSAAAFPRLLSHANFFSLRDPCQKQRTVRHYLELSRYVPTFDVSFKSGLDKLPSVLDGIEEGVLAEFMETTSA